MFSILAFIATIPAANWMIGHIGQCSPGGPCVIPIAPGLMAPSGVLIVGVSLVLRDVVQKTHGPWAAIGAILVGSLLSFGLSPASIALASATAFLLSELVDFAVYTPLARRRLITAVLLSGLAGAFVDSALFLWLAFGNTEFVLGHTIGKLYASCIFSLWLWSRRCGST